MILTRSFELKALAFTQKKKSVDKFVKVISISAYNKILTF